MVEPTKIGFDSKYGAIYFIFYKIITSFWLQKIQILLVAIVGGVYKGEVRRSEDRARGNYVTYSPGDALFGNGRRENRGDTGIAGICGSNDLRTNNGDDNIGLCE